MARKKRACGIDTFPLVESLIARAKSVLDLSRKIDFPQSTICTWKGNETQIKLQDYIAIAKGVGANAGYELSLFLKELPRPEKAEHLLGQIDYLPKSEQLKLISIVADNLFRQEDKTMSLPECLKDLIEKHLRENDISAEQFIRRSRISKEQYLGIMRGELIGDENEINILLDLLANILISPTTGEKFGDQLKLICFCSTESQNSQESAPTGTGCH